MKPEKKRLFVIIITTGKKLLLTLDLSAILEEWGFDNRIISMPSIELFERMEDTVKREIMEETGLEITNIKQLKTYEIINKPDEHRIIIYWSADYDKNSVQSATDLADAKFYSKEEIKELD